MTQLHWLCPDKCLYRTLRFLIASMASVLPVKVNGIVVDAGLVSAGDEFSVGADTFLISSLPVADTSAPHPTEQTAKASSKLGSSSTLNP